MGSRAASGTCGIAAVLIIAAAFVQLIGLQDGHSWGDDFAMYIMHAKNLAEGRAFADTGYIYNRDNPSVGPRAYPPLYPVLLAPVYWLRGLDYLAFKRQLVVIAALLMAVVAAVVIRALPSSVALTVLALIAFNPYIGASTNVVGSDLLFALLCWVFFLLHRAGGDGGDLARAVMLGAIAWAAIATRTVGVVLPGVLLLYDAVQQRRLRRSTLVTVAVTGLMLLVQKLAMGIDTSYADQLAFEPGRIAGHVRRYAMALQDLWSGVLPPIADKLLLVPVVGVALVGFRECLRQPTLLEVFTPAYVAVICLWPSFQDTRFLLPVVPAMALYAGAGFVALKRRSPGVQTAAISLVVVLGVVYALDLAAREPGPVRGGPDTPAARACFAFIREQTPPGAVLLFRKPRAMALYTGRHVSAFPLEPARLWSYAQEIGAGFLVTGPVDRDWLRVLVTQASNHLTLIYRNEAFGVYRIENSGG